MKTLVHDYGNLSWTWWQQGLTDEADRLQVKVLELYMEIGREASRYSESLWQTLRNQTNNYLALMIDRNVISDATPRAS